MPVPIQNVQCAVRNCLITNRYIVNSRCEIKSSIICAKNRTIPRVCVILCGCVCDVVGLFWRAYACWGDHPGLPQQHTALPPAYARAHTAGFTIRAAGYAARIFRSTKPPKKFEKKLHLY